MEDVNKFKKSISEIAKLHGIPVMFNIHVNEPVLLLPSRYKEVVEEIVEEGIEIIVNTKSKKWHTCKISYEEVVKLVFDDNPYHNNVVYTITYHSKSRGDGTLIKGESVDVSNGMIINVSHTNNA